MQRKLRQWNTSNRPGKAKIGPPEEHANKFAERRSCRANPSLNKRSGENREAVRKPELEQYATDGERPNHTEHRPAPTASQVDQQERRIGPGDQGVNRTMIKNHQGMFGARRGGAVIKSGSSIKTDK